MALVTKRVMNACPRSVILVIHFIVGGVAVLMAKLGTRRSASVYRGEWAYRTRSKAFKTRLGSSFTVRLLALNNFLIVLNSFIRKILKY